MQKPRKRTPTWRQAWVRKIIKTPIEKCSKVQSWSPCQGFAFKHRNNFFLKSDNCCYFVVIEKIIYPYAYRVCEFLSCIEQKFQVLWIRNGTCVVYPCHAIIVSMQANNGQQQFFIGHTDKVIYCLSVCSLHLSIHCSNHLTHRI